MADVPDFYGPLSLRLSRVLDDIGMSRRVVMRRRRTFMQIEADYTMSMRLLGERITTFYFGSQSEGTTTPGLNSDIDKLVSMDADVINIMSTLSDWKAGGTSMLMVKEESCSPQHYQLQAMRPDFPVPFTFPPDRFCVIGRHGRILRSSQMFKIINRQLAVYLNHDFFSSGPSSSTLKMHDCVIAYRCKFLPKECISWLHRPRPGHWPSPEIFQVARQTGCFLVADGHCDSLEKHIEWRLSLNLIERSLMFSMKQTMLHCYVVLKMLKKFVINPALEEHGKLTSFHCKTALFFAVENLPPRMWKDDRLVECIIYCLNLLHRWSMIGNCPHYIVAGVNLFDGKFSRPQQYKLSVIISRIVKCDLSVLLHVSADDVSYRLFVPTLARVFLPTRTQCNSRIFGRLDVIMHWKVSLNIRFFLTQHADDSPREMIEYLCQLIDATALHSNDQNTDCETNTKRALCGFLASVVSSHSIKNNIEIGHICWALYELSLPTDVVSNRLKLASMLYCHGDLMRAANVLEDVERMYNDRVLEICSCGRMDPLTTHIRDLNDKNDNNGDRIISGCVVFIPQEAFCVPPMLVYEMLRGRGNDSRLRRYSRLHWMNWAVVDAQPFLYYLQFLTYCGLGRRRKQQTAYDKFVFSCQLDMSPSFSVYHRETVVNLTGHCMEINGFKELALRMYRLSLQHKPTNNAARWHIFRIQNGIDIWRW